MAWQNAMPPFDPSSSSVCQRFGSYIATCARPIEHIGVKWARPIEHIGVKWAPSNTRAHTNVVVL